MSAEKNRNCQKLIFVNAAKTDSEAKAELFVDELFVLISRGKGVATIFANPLSYSYIYHIQASVSKTEGNLPFRYLRK